MTTLSVAPASRPRGGPPGGDGAGTVVGLPEVVFRLDADLRHRYVSPSVEQMVGIAAERFLGRTVQEVGLPAEACDRFEACCRETLATGAATVLEFEHEGGRRRTRIIPEHDAVGAVVGLLGITDAISDPAGAEAERDARHAERVAAERVRCLQAVAAALAVAATPEDIADAIIGHAIAALGAVAGVVGVVDEATAEVRTLRVLGCPAAITGASRRVPLTARSPYADAARAGVTIWFDSDAAMVARYPDLGRVTGRTAYGAAGVVPLRVDGRTIGVLGVRYADPGRVTDDARALARALADLCAQALERARLYEAERRARLEAEAALRGRREFVAQVSHDLRTPLTSIRGYAELMHHRGAYSEQGLAAIIAQAALMERLLDDLSEAAQLEHGGHGLRRAQVDLVAVARSCADDARQHSDRHEVVLEAAQPKIEGWWDGDRLRQVFQNLLGNAIKYSPDGGPIVVRLAEVAGEARVSIADRGLGVPSDALPRLFDQFYRGETTGGVEGLGLGLYITKTLVEAHGGRIWAESEGKWRGATFAFTLPSRPPMAP